MRSLGHAAGTDIDEERGIGRHDNDVAVALEPGHPCGVAQRCAEVGSGRTFTCRPFAYEDFDALAIVAVVTVRIDKELLCGAVEVGVKRVVVVVENVRTNGRDRRRRDELQVRVLLFDCFVKLTEARVVGAGFVVVLLIADLHEVELEGRGMTGFGALRTPSG
jgi:hypothetical protein